MKATKNSPAPQRRPGGLGPSDHPLLFLQGGAVPRFDAHPDPPGNQISSAREPLRTLVAGYPDVLVEGIGVLGFDVGGAVLEAEHVSRRGLLASCRRGAAEAEL
jgi:hypothetical protein